MGQLHISKLLNWTESHRDTNYHKYQILSNILLVLHRDDVNISEPECMFTSRNQNSGQNHDIKIGIRSFKTVTKF
jgi:hypothetical protein